MSTENIKNRINFEGMVTVAYKKSVVLYQNHIRKRFYIHKDIEIDTILIFKRTGPKGLGKDIWGLRLNAHFGHKLPPSFILHSPFPSPLTKLQSTTYTTHIIISNPPTLLYLSYTISTDFKNTKHRHSKMYFKV